MPWLPSTSLLTLLTLLTPALARADGMLWVAPHAQDLVAEKAQQAWLEWDAGRERLTVAVDPVRVSTNLAWILPVPVPAAQARLSLTDKRPGWGGQEVRLGAQLSLSPGLTAFYFLVFVLAGVGAGEAAAVLGILFLLGAIAIPNFGGTPGLADAVAVSQRTELGGLVSELADAPTLEAFEAYLAAKSAVLPDAARGPAAEHIRSGGSFAVSWAQDASVEKSLAVSIEFPAAKPWYPVRLTGAYGAVRMPIDLRLAGWWVPEGAPERLRVGYYRADAPPRDQTRLLYEGKASGLSQDWTLRPRGWSPDLRLAAFVDDSPVSFTFALLLLSSLLGGAAAGLTAFPDWRGRAGLWPLAALGAAGLLPYLGPSVALRKLRSGIDGVPPWPPPEGMTQEEVGRLKLRGCVAMGLGFACYPVAAWLDSAIPFFTGWALGALGVGLFMRGKGRPWGDACLIGIFTAPFYILGPLTCAIPEDPRVYAAGQRKVKAARAAMFKPDPVPEGMEVTRFRMLRVSGGSLMAVGMALQVYGLVMSESLPPYAFGTLANAAGAMLYLRTRGRGVDWRGLAAAPLVIVPAVLCAAPLPLPDDPAYSVPVTPAEARWRRAAAASAALAFLLSVGAMVGLGRAWSAKDSTAQIVYSGLIRKSNEGATRGNLGAVRAALSIYFADHEGAHAPDLQELTVNGKYLSVLPKAKTPGYHADSTAVLLAGEPDDSGGWVYDPATGEVKVNCTHTDTKGSAWDSY